MHLRDVLARRRIELPGNVVFVDYDEDVSSFNLVDLVRGLVAYTSSAAMEMGLSGKRSVISKEAHYSCAGFVAHPQSREEFFRELDALLATPEGDAASADTVKLAHAYYLLYNRVTQIDMGLIEGNDIGTIPAKLRYEGIDELAPGANAALDYVCDAILTGKPIFGADRWPPVT
jgi:hypothetical protein